MVAEGLKTSRVVPLIGLEAPDIPIARADTESLALWEVSLKLRIHSLLLQTEAPLTVLRAIAPFLLKTFCGWSVFWKQKNTGLRCITLVCDTDRSVQTMFQGFPWTSKTNMIFYSGAVAIASVADKHNEPRGTLLRRTRRAASSLSGANTIICFSFLYFVSPFSFHACTAVIKFS